MVKHFCDICNKEIKPENPSCTISITNNKYITFNNLVLFKATEICGECTREIRQKIEVLKYKNLTLS